MEMNPYGKESTVYGHNRGDRCNDKVSCFFLVTITNVFFTTSIIIIIFIFVYTYMRFSTL